MILKYFHIQTSAIQRKYPTLIVRIFLVSARTHSISRYIHIQTLCVHKRNVLRFLQHGTYHVVVRGGSHFCQSPKSGGVRSFFIKMQGRANTFLGKKIPKFPSPPPPKKKRTFPNQLRVIQYVRVFSFTRLRHSAVSKITASSSCSRKLFSSRNRYQGHLLLHCNVCS